ncbi:hypothetical protein FQR65_LT01571 [Abscondita terminalis]|nr:hypothetical protein FQR65_LT01571 [Abscondita terminalis]
MQTFWQRLWPQEAANQITQATPPDEDNKSVESENDEDSSQQRSKSPEKMGPPPTPRCFFLLPRNRAKKRPRIEEKSNEISKAIKKLDEVAKESLDEKLYDQFGKFVVSKLRLLPQRQAILVQQEIQNSIINAKLSSLEQEAPQSVHSAFSPFSDDSFASTSASSMHDDDGDVLQQVLISTFGGNTT